MTRPCVSSSGSRFSSTIHTATPQRSARSAQSALDIDLRGFATGAAPLPLALSIWRAKMMGTPQPLMVWAGVAATFIACVLLVRGQAAVRVCPHCAVQRRCIVSESIAPDHSSVQSPPQAATRPTTACLRVLLASCRGVRGAANATARRHQWSASAPVSISAVISLPQ